MAPIVGIPHSVLSFRLGRLTLGTDVNVRDLSGAKDIEMSLGHYLKNLRKLSSKFTENDYEGSQQRLYAKGH